jgi:hypothetical protein
MTDAHSALDVLTTVLLGLVGFFAVRLVRQQDTHDDRLNNHAQRLSQIDGKIEGTA